MGTTESNNKSHTKNYLVLAECGHCERGYFIPALFWIDAQSVEEVKKIGRLTPRVKHDKMHAIIMCEERPLEECWLSKHINDFDEFLTSRHMDETCDEVRERRIRTPLYIKNLEQNILKYKREDDISEYKKIKTSDQYSPHLVLQRYCAPVYGGRILSFKKINFDAMLHEYFEEMTKMILNSHPHYTPTRTDKRSKELLQSLQGILIDYYLIYKKDNSLGVTFDPNTNILSHEASSNSFLVTSKDFRNSLADIANETTPHEETVEDFEDVSPSLSRPNQIDKFYARLAKTATFRDGK